MRERGYENGQTKVMRSQSIERRNPLTRGTLTCCGDIEKGASDTSEGRKGIHTCREKCYIKSWF